MHKKITFVFLSSFAVLLSACSGGSTSSSGGKGGLIIEGALTSSELQENNQVEVSPEQVRNDLELLVKLENLPTVPEIPSMGSIPESEGNYFLHIGNTLAKRIGSFAADECITFDQDTTYFEDGMQFTGKVRGYNKNGSKFHICQSQIKTPEQAFTFADGLRIETTVTGRGANMDQDMIIVQTISAKNVQTDPRFDMNGKAYSYFQIKYPESLSFYMEMDFSIIGPSEYNNGREDFSFTLWFMDGRYLCEVLDSDIFMQEYSSGKMCDLVNANKVVGSLRIDRYGDMIVYDVNGDVIQN